LEVPDGFNLFYRAFEFTSFPSRISEAGKSMKKLYRIPPQKLSKALFSGLSAATPRVEERDNDE
jgi:hypothetical protein